MVVVAQAPNDIEAQHLQDVLDACAGFHERPVVERVHAVEEEELVAVLLIKVTGNGFEGGHLAPFQTAQQETGAVFRVQPQLH